MKRTIATIGQRTTYPRAMRVAVVKSHAKASTVEVARDYNVSTSTVCRWAAAANAAKPQPKQLAAHQAATAAIKAFNTPKVNVDAKGVTTITYRGKIYK